MLEVEVHVDFAELQNRTNKLRHHAETIISKTKEKLEQAARESGLPVTFTLVVGMKFPRQEQATDKRPYKPKVK